MSQFINITDYDASIHKEILDSLVRGDATDDTAVVEVCEDRAISEMRSYMNKKYDCDNIFSARSNERHPLVLMMAIDITVYHLWTMHNPYKMSNTRKDRYDRAIEWLKGVSREDIVIDGAPTLPQEELQANSRWQMESNRLRQTHF